MNMNQPIEKTREIILVADDDAGDVAALGRLLHPHYDVFAAPSGERALQIAAGIPKPDLILLDVLMPEMDGYEVLIRLRDNPATRDIPVIFISGLDSIEDEEKGLELGAVDYIAKPYRPPIILARVHTWLELKRSRDRLRDQNAILEAEVDKRLKENQQVQGQLLHSEKMAAIGQLAAGIAHEINNPVGFVTSNLKTLDIYKRDILEILDTYETLEAACAPDAEALLKIHALKQQKDFGFIRTDLDQLIAESQQGMARVAKIVSDLKDFAHAENKEWLWADLNNGLDSTLNIVRNEIKYHCTLNKAYGDIPKVYCMASQINQVLLNLLVNAAQAIPEKGEITVRTGQEGEEVFVAIADTGSGIPAGNLKRIFEPFFTTKPVGKGTGLGLAISFDIVQKHKGRIEVESTVGKGTTFTVWLPVNSQVEDAARKAS
ncbi:MAG: response regulator [Gammaproteobacteria bacterium]|nr:response regulator [Gammaproteobacteria bacterium]MBU1481310.1 response regulator [Gammaproteobacteria bacterium]